MVRAKKKKKSNETDPLKIFTEHFTIENLLCSFSKERFSKETLKFLDWHFFPRQS